MIIRDSTERCPICDGYRCQKLEAAHVVEGRDLSSESEHCPECGWYSSWTRDVTDDTHYGVSSKVRRLARVT